MSASEMVIGIFLNILNEFPFEMSPVYFQTLPRPFLHVEDSLGNLSVRNHIVCVNYPFHQVFHRSGQTSPSKHQCLQITANQ